jgi:ABC-2 type transport system ATP-binding protein
VASAALRDDLASLAGSQGVTIFLTTHNLVEAERLCALVGVIRTGRLVGLGPPRALGGGNDNTVVITGSGFAEAAIAAVSGLPDVLNVVLDGAELSVTLLPGASNAPVVAALVQHGVGIEEVRRARQTLEDVFLELVAEGPATSRDGAAGPNAD